MDVVDAGVDETQPVVPPVGHPHRDVALGGPAPPSNLQRLPKIVLRHAGEDCADDDEAEHEQLGGERILVACFERVEEARIPGIDRHRDIDEPEFCADDP